MSIYKNRLFQFWHHQVSYQKWASSFSGQQFPVEGVVIPCVGESYIAEASLAANFSAHFVSDVKEVVIVTNLPSNLFHPENQKIKIHTIQHKMDFPDSKWRKIWESRIVKINAPQIIDLNAFVMIDSDLNLLRNLSLNVADGALFGAFRKGRIDLKVKGDKIRSKFLKYSIKPFAKFHINGGFLAATQATWGILSHEWNKVYQEMWAATTELIQPPTDQLPLAIALDRMKLKTVDIGWNYNWPVSKMIGGSQNKIPDNIIGAHGGFPITEWEKFLQNKNSDLLFEDVNYSRKVRYHI
jgi:hypothetical protein